jgi:two-component system, NtrC family, sensor histidine kinase PilS
MEPMNRQEPQRQIVGLMAYRVVVITTLLLSTFIIELIFQPAVPLRPFYQLGGLTYLLSLAYALAHRRMKDNPVFVPLQLAGDVLVVTGLVYVTGGPVSPFSFLYLILIITASILLFRRGGILIALGAWLLYAILVEATYFQILPLYPHGDFQGADLSERRILYLLFAHLFSFLTVAYLTSHVSEMLRNAGEKLAAQENDLAELRIFNEDIIDSMNSGLITTGLDGRITFSNRAASQITGYPEPDLSRRHVSELLGTGEAFLPEVRSALEQANRFRFEKEFTARGGAGLFLGFTASILRNKEGVPVGFIFIFQDLTEIRVLEEEVALKKRMAALGEMAAGMAHELRNPLASISGSVQVLRRDLPAGSEQSELMGIILQESRRLDQTIRDFLLFAKPGRFTPEEVDLSEILSDSLKLLRNSEEFRPNHSLKTSFHPESIPVVVDANRMRQVFWNLAKNALKAMPGGGTLTVKALGEMDGQVLVSFSDEGIGMGETEVAKNFQPFHGSFQSGTGLGLAIVYRIVQEHRGRIRIKSRRGAGTEVQILLPKTQADSRRVLQGESWIGY